MNGSDTKAAADGANRSSGPLVSGLSCAPYQFSERPLLRRRAQWYTPAIGRRATFAAYAMMAVGLALGAAFSMAQAARP